MYPQNTQNTRKVCSGLLVLIITTCSGVAQMDIKRVVQVNDVSNLVDKAISMDRAESFRFDTYVRYGTGVVDLTSASFPVLYVWCPRNGLTYLAVTGSVASATQGLARVSLTREQTNLSETNDYAYRMRMYRLSGTNTEEIATVARGPWNTRWVPDAEAYELVSGAIVTALQFTVNLVTYTNAGAGSGDMAKATYDANTNGVVDNAEAVGGESLTSLTNKIATSAAAAATAQVVANVATTAVAVAQSTANSAQTIANAATVAVAVAQSTANAATVSVAALSANFVASSGKWSGVISFAGVTNPQACSAFYFRGTQDLHTVTGCTSYITYSNASSGPGGSFTVTVGASNETEQVYLNNSASATWTMDATGGLSVAAIGSGGGMVLIQSVYVSTNGVSLIEFQNIPQTYKDLYVSGQLRSAGNGEGMLRVNNSSGNTYDYSRILNAGGAVADSQDNVTQWQIRMSNESAATNHFGTYECFIIGYTNYTRDITMQSRQHSVTGAGQISGIIDGVYSPGSGGAVTSLAYHANISSVTNYIIGSYLHLFAIQ